MTWKNTKFTKLFFGGGGGGGLRRICWFAAQETFLIIINVENSFADLYFFVETMITMIFWIFWRIESLKFCQLTFSSVCLLMILNIMFFLNITIFSDVNSCGCIWCFIAENFKVYGILFKVYGPYFKAVSNQVMMTVKCSYHIHMQYIYSNYS